ncbi:serine/threonine protein kinase [Gordonia sp. NPDC058843]|uniref:serine/threonine protein kinase n=1 Tax=Gordonia sp. NPDC058843 TaxID=3346648 RepID=UPI0036CDC08F
MSVGPTHDEPLAPGALVGPYRVDRLLRRRPGVADHLATVRHPSTPPERVLLTVVDRMFSADPAFRSWFPTAVEKASAVEHPGIANVVGHGYVAGRLWVAITPVPVSDAALLIRRHPDGIDVDLAVRIVTVVGDALDAAHRRRLVHGNVSPADILLARPDDLTGSAASAPGVVTLTGFGLTAPAAGDQMPHPATDVASLGRTLVELLTGTGSVARHRISGAVSPAFYAVLARALDADSDHRYRTCAEFVRAAELALHLTRTDGEPPTEILDSPPPADVPHTFQPTGHPDRPTDIVTDRHRGLAPAIQSTRPPPPTSPTLRRRRLIAPFLVASVTVAVVVGTLMLLGARTARPPWPSTVAPIAAAFPRLLPESPEATGWRDAACAAVVRDGVVGISCTDAASVGFVVWRTSTTPTRAAVTAGLKGYPGDEISWRDGPASASRDSVVDGWVVTNFARPPHAEYTLVTTWPGHTGREILDDWWRTAPLG